MIQESPWQEMVASKATESQDAPDKLDYYGNCLAQQVIAGKITIDELRAGLVWANALDKEAVEAFSQNIDMSEADVLEAKARRLAHHAGRRALSQVKSAHRRLIYEVRNSHNIHNFTY